MTLESDRIKWKDIWVVREVRGFGEGKDVEVLGINYVGSDEEVARAVYLTMTRYLFDSKNRIQLLVIPEDLIATEVKRYPRGSAELQEVNQRSYSKHVNACSGGC